MAVAPGQSVGKPGEAIPICVPKAQASSAAAASIVIGAFLP